MTNNIILITLLFLSNIFTCSAGNDEYIVQGNISNSTQKAIYLEKLTHNTITLVDSSTLGKNGSFRMKSNIEEQGLYRISIQANDNPRKLYWLLSIYPGEKITAVLDANNVLTSKITGNKEQADFQEFMTNVNTKNSEISQLLNQYKSLQQSNPRSKDLPAISKLIQNKSMNLTEIMVKTFEEKDGNVLKYFVISTYLQQLQGGTIDDKMTKLFGDYVKKIEASNPQSIYTQDMKTAYTRSMAMKQQKANAAMTQAGGMAPNIELVKDDGSKSSLHDYRGKVVLLDFWASWCRPCRMENPHVVKAYKKYKDKGFIVLSVSQDRNLDHWKRAIQKDGLIWDTHFADQKAGGMGSRTYKVNYIPKTFLIDKNGKIVATDLRGHTLEAQLEKLLN